VKYREAREQVPVWAVTKLRCVIFDLDGTLGDTLPVCFEAYWHAFEKFLGRHYTDREIAALFGPTEEGIVQRLVPEQWPACLEAYLGAHERMHNKYLEPVTGIEDALRLLRRRGGCFGDCHWERSP
jgi:pyrophosphatase PpaX